MGTSNSIAKNSIYYSTSTLICMVLPLVFYPYLTRVLGPEYFGKIAFAQTLISYFLILSTLGINNYAQKVCAVSRDDKFQLSKATYEILIISGVLTLVSLISYFGCLKVIAIESSDYPLYFIFTGMIIFSSLGMNWLLVAKEKFFFTSVRDVISKVVLLAGCFLFVKRKEDFILFGMLYTFTYAVLPAFMNFGYIGKEKIITHVPMKELSLKEHLEPIFFLSLVTIGSKIFSSADILMVRFFQGDSAVGIYNNAIKLPLVLDELLMAIAAVVTPGMYAAVKTQDENKIYHLINYASNAMFFCAIPAIITCIFFPTELLELLGGKEYISGGNILVVYSFIMLTTLCLTLVGTRMFIAKGMEKQLFYFLLLAGTVNIGLNMWLIPVLGAFGAAVASVISNFALLVAEVSYADTAKYLLDKDKLKYIIAGVVLSLVLLGIRTFMEDRTAWRLGIAISVGGVFYVCTLIACKESTLMRILGAVNSKLKMYGREQGK